MLHHSISQMAEMADLDQRLRGFRIQQMHAGLAGSGSATRTPELDRQAEAVLQEVTAKYRSQAWKKMFPPPDEEEPNPKVREILASSRECSLRSLLMLHQQIMELPVVGCPPASPGDMAARPESQSPDTSGGT